MKWSTEKKIAVGIAVVLAMLMINALISYRATRRLITNNQWVTHTHEVLAELETTLSLAKDAETGQRGYVITGKESYLEPYEAALGQIDGHLQRLDQLTADNPDQQARLPALKQLVTERLDFLRRGVELKRGGDGEKLRQHFAAGRGKARMDALRALVAEMIDEENALLKIRDAESRASSRDAILTFSLASLIACALLFVVAYVVLRDLAARQRDAELLHRQREWLRVTLSSIGDGVIATDTDGRVLFINSVAETLIGWRQSEAEGQPLAGVFSIVNEQTRRAVDNPALRAIEDGHVVGLTNHTILITRSGSEIPIDDSGAPILSADGKILGAVLIFRDITERHRAEHERARLLDSERAARAEAEAASRAKDEFVAITSHELRTPLNAILGWAQLMRTGQFSAGETAHAIEAIERNARMQAQIIEDLLDMSRIITGKLRLEVCPVALRQTVEAALDAVRPAVRAKAIHLGAAFEAEGALVSGDADRLQQVVWNLLSNAVKFTPRGGRVDVKLTRLDSRVEIVVSDTGEGISAEFLPYIFERFRQADNSSSAGKQSGLGLGLALVRHLVELHGGSVRAHSDGRDRGATFTVTLPLSETQADMGGDEPGDASRPAARLAEGIALGGTRLLIVDDEADTRDLLTAVLSRHGAEVRTCVSSGEALALLEHWRPDVLIADIGMPDEDGYTLLRKIRALPPERGGRIPAAALTAFARSEDRVRALAAGFQMHIAKPVEITELVIVIASLAASAGRDGPS
jgi:PAS domain S-box-containing protein